MSQFRAPGSLREPNVARVLERMHRGANADMLRILFRAPSVVPHFLGFRKMADDVLSRKMRDTYLPVSASQGEMLYLVARSIDARRIVEFGTSFGVSTMYLAAAVKDNGGGMVIGTELEPSKRDKATANLAEAGLSPFTNILLGDALKTLVDVEGPVDMVLLDGWKEGYLEVLALLRPKLRPRAVVLADNIHRFKRALRPYVEHVQSGNHGFVSSTLEIADGFEMSVFTG